MLRSVCACVCLLVLLADLCATVERGFVYCPAYPCTCESKDGALIINCGNLYLSELPKFLSFDGRVKELCLRENNIRHLPANGFRRLHIENLDLLENVITSIHDDAFSGLETSLKSLSLQLYAMTGLPTAALLPLRSLRTLIVSGCKVPELKKSMFAGLSQLREVHLIGCRLSHIQARALSPLTGLQKLVLTHNSLRYQHLSELNVLGSLVELDLSFNDIQLLDNLALPRLSKLRRLKLAYNKLTYISKRAFYNLDFCLEELGLSNNELKEQALESLVHLKTLRQVDLSSNNISTLYDESYFRGQIRLTHLNMAFNNLNILTARCLDGLAMTLESFDLHANPLEIIERGSFSGFERLRHLNLNSTNIGESIRADTFDGLEHSLTYLDVSHAKLTSKDISMLANLSTLKKLDADNNNITYVEFSLFGGWDKINDVDLSHNSISEFPTGNLTGINSSLKRLDLSWNKLTEVQDCTFFLFTELVEVGLEENPLDCSCGMSWLFRWMQIANPVDQAARWRCATPEKLTGQLFVDLDHADLGCPNRSETDHRCISLYNVRLRTTSTDATQFTKPSPRPATPVQVRIVLNISRPGPDLIHVTWSTDDAETVGGFMLSVRHMNNSSLLESLDIPKESYQHTFFLQDASSAFDNEICLAALNDNHIPMAEDCEPVPVYLSPILPSPENKLYNVLYDSFVPLMLIYVSGSLAVAFMIACIVICVRRRREKAKCRNGAYPAGYPAWLDHRSSMSSAPLTPHIPHTYGTIHRDDVASARSGGHRMSPMPGHYSPRSPGTYPGTGERFGLDTSVMDSTMVHDLPTIIPSRRGSRTPSCTGQGAYACAAMNPASPLHFPTGLHERTEIEDDFYFHF